MNNCISAKNSITSLGITKQHKCPYCGKYERLKNDERYNLVNCMMNNCRGLWALLHCGHCGYVDKVYPIRINGISCTPKECDKLIEEIKKYDKENINEY